MEAKRRGRKAQDGCYSSINAGTWDGPAADNDKSVCKRETERGGRGAKAVILTGC